MLKTSSTPRTLTYYPNAKRTITTSPHSDVAKARTRTSFWAISQALLGGLVTVALQSEAEASPLPHHRRGIYAHGVVTFQAPKNKFSLFSRQFARTIGFLTENRVGLARL
jgi:hypothetical protein